MKYMDVKRGEFEKLYRNPIFIILIGIFLIYNVMIMYNNLGIREPLKLTNELIRDVGYKIDDSMFKKLTDKYDLELEELNEITTRKFNKRYDSMNDFLESDEFKKNIYRNDVFSKEEENFINRLSILNMYKNSTPIAISEIENIDFNKIANGGISTYGLTGDAANFVQSNYRDFGHRFEELIANGEHKNLYFQGLSYRTHSLLFGDIIKACIMEIMIIVVLGMVFLVNYERENKTLGLVVASKRGRRIITDKLQVGLVFSILVTSIILGITLIAYFNVFDYSEVWNVPISSVFNVEESGPFLSWYNLSIKEYLMISIGIVLILALLSSGLAFLVGSLLKSSYKSFFLFWILFGVLFMLSSIFKNDSILKVLSNFNISVLSLNPKWWLMEAGPLIGSKHYVDISLISNGFIICILSLLSIRLFKKESI